MTVKFYDISLGYRNFAYTFKTAGIGIYKFEQAEGMCKTFSGDNGRLFIAFYEKIYSDNSFRSIFTIFKHGVFIEFENSCGHGHVFEQRPWIVSRRFAEVANNGICKLSSVESRN